MGGLTVCTTRPGRAHRVQVMPSTLAQSKHTMTHVLHSPNGPDHQVVTSFEGLPISPMVHMPWPAAHIVGSHTLWCVELDMSLETSVFDCELCSLPRDLRAVTVFLHV